MPEQQDLDKLMQILSGIERKRTIEKIGGNIRDNGEIIEVQNNSQLSQDGGIEDNTTFTSQFLDCGCIAQSRMDVAGRDWMGFLTCKNHYWRCSHCHRGLSPKTVRVINGKCYCGRCFWLKKFFPAFIK